jgi:hypothetical protein
MIDFGDIQIHYKDTFEGNVVFAVDINKTLTIPAQIGPGAIIKRTMVVFEMPFEDLQGFVQRAQWEIEERQSNEEIARIKEFVKDSEEAEIARLQEENKDIQEGYLG